MVLLRQVLALVAAALLLLGICGDHCANDDDGPTQKHPPSAGMHFGCHCICNARDLPAPLVLPEPSPIPAVTYAVIAVQCADQFVPQPEPPPVIAA